MSAKPVRRRRWLRPWMCYVLAFAGILFIPDLGSFVPDGSRYEKLVSALAALAVVPWAWAFMLLAWRRTDEVGRAAQKSSWLHGASAGAALAAALLMFLIGIMIQDFPSFDYQPATRANPGHAEFILGKGMPGTKDYQETKWDIIGEAPFGKAAGTLMLFGLIAGILLTLAVQFIGYMIALSAWWIRIWTARDKEEA